MASAEPFLDASLDTENRSRMSAETRDVLATLLVWVVWSAVMFLNVFLEEAVGRWAEYETEFSEYTYKATMQLCNWLGGAAWCIVVSAFWLLALPATPFPVLQVYRQRHIRYYICLCAAVFYITIVTMGFLEPNKSWRQLELAERSLSSGGEMATGCYLVPNPRQIKVEANITYYMLTDKGWYVDWDSRQTHTKWGWTWLSAPIKYNGPVHGCKFDPPIYAGCIAKSPSPERCFFTNTSAYTIIRKLDQSEYSEAWMEEKIPYTGPSRGHYVMEWDSQSRYETQEYVDKINRYADDQWRDVSIAWFFVTGVGFIVAVVGMRRQREAEASLSFFDLNENVDDEGRDFGC